MPFQIWQICPHQLQNSQILYYKYLFFFCLKHTIPVITDANVLQTFTPLGYGELLAKNNFQDKLAGGGGLGQENIQKFTTYFCNLEARNFKFGTQHEFGFTLPNTTFRTNIDGSELGQYTRAKKIETPRPTFTIIEAINFKFVHNLDFAKSFSKRISRLKLTIRTPKFWDPYDADATIYDTILCS